MSCTGGRDQRGLHGRRDGARYRHGVVASLTVLTSVTVVWRRGEREREEEERERKRKREREEEEEEEREGERELYRRRI